MRERDVISVNVAQRVAVLDDFTPLEITNFFDEDGDECDEDGDAVYCVATDGNLWWAIDLREFENIAPN